MISPTRHMVKAAAFAGAVLVALAVVLVPGTRLQRDGSGTVRTPAPPPVTLEVARLGEFRDVVEAPGTAQAIESAELRPTVTAVVERVHFSDGMVVSAGDVLLTLNSVEPRAALAEAEALLTKAEQQLERINTLFSRGEISQSMLDDARAAQQVAQARVDQLRARLQDYVIRAPFAGILGFRQVSPGTVVTGAAVITTIDDITTILVEFSVPEVHLTSLAIGQEVQARSPAYPAREFSGFVTTIRPRVDPVTRAVTVRASFSNLDRALRPGMLLTVSLILYRGQALFVPEEADPAWA